MPAHINLFNLLECRIIVTPNPWPQAVAAIVAAHDIEVLEIPTVEELLNKSYPPYAYTKSFEDARKEPLVVLHTSGTTGLPKPIIWTHDFAASWLQWIELAEPPGYANKHFIWCPARLFFLFPPFHVS
jgi:acyl-coenzyme A synthetase/AMP-(fatty) acid ligase